MPSTPRFSVIIPTFNRPACLRACLNGFLGINFPRNQFEVVVVDDGSLVKPNDVVEPFREHLDISLITQQHAGPATARNTGATRARGSYLAFTDDDCVPSPGWLCALSYGLTESPECLVGGAIVNGLPENSYSETTQMIQAYVYDYHQRRPDTVFLFNGSNMAMSARRFADLGGFSPSFRQAGGEDYDFCNRWHVAGLKSSYVPGAIVYHTHPLNFRGFCRQHFTYGRGLLVCRARMGSQSGRRLRLEAAGFYIGMFLFPLSQGVGLGRWLKLARVFLSQAATIAGACIEAIALASRRRHMQS